MASTWETLSTFATLARETVEGKAHGAGECLWPPDAWQLIDTQLAEISVADWRSHGRLDYSARAGAGPGDRPVRRPRLRRLTRNDSEVAMGTWGSGVFANDDAMDWVAGLEDTDDISVVERALGAVSDADDYLEAPTCTEALAAAEAVATILKQPGVDVPSEVFEWIARVGRDIPPSLPDEALRAIDRIESDSELLELWEEAGEPSLGEWKATLAELRGRLG